MSDELKKQGVINYFDILNQTKQTFEEAEEQIKAESPKQRAERFRMSDDGEYSIRILPLVPNLDSEGHVLPMERHGFEYPVHQQFLKIELPKKKGDKKEKFLNVPVICSTDKGVGKSVDLIDTYIKIAKEMYADDVDLLELLEKSNFFGGLKWSYVHAMYVLDLTNDGRKGPLLWQATHSQYCTIRDAKQRLWAKERQKDLNRDCPVCGFKNAYPVTIIRSGANKRTEYTIEIDRYTDDLTEDDLMKLFELPRIPEQVFSFTRYALEAEVYFLQQYDEKHEMEVTKEPDFIEAVERLKGEMSPDDKSHFDINKSGDEKDGKSSGKEEVTVNSLWAELDAIEDAGLSEKSDEYQELREKIRQFIEDKDLDIRLTRSKNNEKLIKEIEDALEDKGNAAPVAKVEEHDDEPESDDEPKQEEKPVEEEKPTRRRRPRPGSEEPEAEPEKNDKPETKDDSASDEDEEERPVQRRERRRR